VTKDATWILRLDSRAKGPRVAVKDAIDMAGLPTTVGCKALADDAKPADIDAACLAGIRAAGLPVVGKTNLHELCFGTTGINAWYGTPVNPAAPDHVPGGSSSGSAVAVASGEADLALGTDTGGSVRIPAACCGVVGLKTTWGAVSLKGVWPLAPSLDTIGPLARDVAGVIAAMALLKPSFQPTSTPATTVGRLSFPDVDPHIDQAVDRALAAAGFSVEPIVLDGWDAVRTPFLDLLLHEAWESDLHLAESDGVSQLIRDRLHQGRDITADRVALARARQEVWQTELKAVFDRVQVLALPTLDAPPPLVVEADAARLNRFTTPFNFSGTPAISLPVPSRRLPVPASLQLAGPAGSEALLCASALAVESAVG
jgi:amidase